MGTPNRTLLDGGAGADLLIGSDYDDTYVVDTPLDTVVETGFLVFASGTSERSTADRVASSVSYTLGAHLEQLELRGTAAISGTGNELDNFIDGATNSAANVVSGGAGNDTYRLGAGDTIVELAGEGDDSVVLTGAAAGQTVANLSSWSNVENLRVEAGLAAFALTGTAAANVLIGNAAANTISGSAGNDTLTTPTCRTCHATAWAD